MMPEADIKKQRDRLQEQIVDLTKQRADLIMRLEEVRDQLAASQGAAQVLDMVMAGGALGQNGAHMTPEAK